MTPLLKEPEVRRGSVQVKRRKHAPAHTPKKPVPPPHKPTTDPSFPEEGPWIWTAWGPGAARPSNRWWTYDILIPGERPTWQMRSGISVIEQAEGGPEYEEALTSIQNHKWPGYVAIVTTLGIVPPQLRGPINTCFVECYEEVGKEPYGDVNRMVWQAHQDGWCRAIPLIGLWPMPDGTKCRIHDYDLAGVGRNFGIWLAEYMDEQDWADLDAYLKGLGL